MWGIERSEQFSVRRAILGEFSVWVIALTVVGAVLTVIGAWDSVRDAGGDRYLGVIPLAVPAVIAIWATLELCWRESDVPIQGRMVFGTLIAQIPAVLFSTAAWTVAGWLGSGVIERTAVGHYDHNYWPTDARGLKAGALMLFGSYAVAVATLLIVALPVQSFRRSREVFAGTDLSDDPAHVAQNLRAMRLAFLALSTGAIAAILYAFEISVPFTIVAVVITALLLAGAAVLAVRRRR